MIMELSTDRMYQAILEKDTAFEGLFFTAVKTTGIFCRPSCTARKPKKEHVEFFSSSKEAITRGYRPCKVCRPLELLHETPEAIKAILKELSDDPSCKFRDEDLEQSGITPSAIRRWFLKQHGITFQAYQRMFRINSAFKKINEGEGVAPAAFGAGYESLSGFSDSFKSIFGVSPGRSGKHRVIDLKRIETPLGTMIACGVKEGICLLEFSDRKMLETELKAISKALSATIVQGDNPHFTLLEQQLREYFEGRRQSFTVPLLSPGSTFQNLVWQGLQHIPYGATRSYKEQALYLERPEAIRAVANANGMNRISILVPCHRVIGADGSLTGYGGGIWRKQWLLEHEQQHR